MLIIWIAITATINSAGAAEWQFDDTYIGGGYDVAAYGSKYYQKDGDVISQKKRINNFDVDGMTVSIDDNGKVLVTILTDYNQTNGLGTRYGDLFISTNGWNPAGTSSDGYMGDTYSAFGEDWEYAFDTNSRMIYDIRGVQANSILLSDDIHGPGNPHWFRHDQEVLIDPSKGAIFSGLGVFSNPSAAILYAFDLSSLGIGLNDGYDLGFRWSMTCANDILEVGGITKAAVPEPATMILLGLGLIGASAVGRRKQAKAIK